MFQICAKYVLEFFFFLNDIFEYTMTFNLVHMYFIKFLNERISLNTINWLINLKCTCYLLFFYHTQVFQILYLTYHKLNGAHNEIQINLEFIFLCLCQKLFHFKTQFWIINFSGIFYHAFTHYTIICVIWNRTQNINNFHLIEFHDDCLSKPLMKWLHLDCNCSCMWHT